jgi:AcrR family transcriptional regulator
MAASRADRVPSTRTADRRQRVLEAALAAITERGVTDTRMADIAARAGMSPGHVLYYFRSKAHILAELLKWNEDRFHQMLEADLRRARSARGRLLRAIRASVPSGRGDPHWLLWLEVWAMAPHDRALLENQGLQESRFQELLAVLIREGQASGEFDASIDAEEAAARLSAVIDGLAIQVAIGAPQMDGRRMLRLATDEATALLGDGGREPRTVDVPRSHHSPPRRSRYRSATRTSVSRSKL